MANDYLIMVANAILAGGIPCFFLSAMFSGKTRVVATIVGYSIISVGVLLLIIKTQIGGDKPQLDALLYMCYPLWLMLVVAGSMITLNLNHTDIISNDVVPPNYFHYSNTIAGLLLIQFYFLLKSPETATSVTKMSIAGLALLQLLIICFILYVILKYYTTDG